MAEALILGYTEGLNWNLHIDIKPRRNIWDRAAWCRTDKEHIQLFECTCGLKQNFQLSIDIFTWKYNWNLWAPSQMAWYMRNIQPNLIYNGPGGLTWICPPCDVNIPTLIQGETIWHAWCCTQLAQQTSFPSTRLFERTRARNANRVTWSTQPASSKTHE